MLIKKFICHFLIIPIITINVIVGQFINVNVNIDMKRLSEGDRQLFYSFAEDIKHYFINTEFSPEVSDLTLIIDCHLVLETVSRGGRETMINAQAIFTNKSDQYFLCNNIVRVNNMLVVK